MLSDAPPGPGNVTDPTCVCNSFNEPFTSCATVSSEPTVTLPVTDSVPAIVVLPLPFATVNLFVSIVRPPFNCVAPVTVKLPNVLSPETPNVPSTSVLSSVVAPSTSKLPTIDVLPDACATTNFEEPTVKLVPSNVKFASSSSSPPAPTITILLLVRSVTLADASVADVEASRVSVSVKPVTCIPVVFVLNFSAPCV